MKKALKFAAVNSIAISIGVIIGGIVLPRLKAVEPFNNLAWPLWKDVVVSFIIVFVASFCTSIFISWIKQE